MHKRLLLVDGSSYFFRAFHALPPLKTTKGQPTGAIYGVASMVRRLLKDYQAEYVAIVFDAPGKTFREEWYPAYKSHRPPTPSELSCQFEPLVEVLKAMGLPIVIEAGVEADDVIATLAHQAVQDGLSVLISTGDKDLAQLVNQHISLINTMSQQTLDIAGVQNKFGVRPEQIIDYLALIGDTSDNIPGVPKCGPKTAVKWLTEYETLEQLIANAHQIGGKIGESLRASIPHLPLAQRLITLKTDVSLPMSYHGLKPYTINTKKMHDLAYQYEFKSWIKEFSDTTPTAITTPKKDPVEIIQTQEQLTRWIEAIKHCQLLSIDTETSGLNALQAKLVGISFAIDPEKPAYLPLAHEDGSTQLDKAQTLLALKPLLECADIKKVGQNLKYDYHIFQQVGIRLNGILFDTMLESYLLNSASARHDMDSLASHYLHYRTIRYEDVTGTGSQQISFQQVPVKIAAEYAGEDASICLKLHHAMYPSMPAPLQQVLHEIEIPILSVLADMEQHGVMLDILLLKKHGERLKNTLIDLEKQAFALAGKTFNLNSPKQLQTLLYDELKLPILSKTPKGQPSTAESVLQELALDYELPTVILNYRSLAKLVSTYIDALPKRVDPRTGRIHTSYNQAVAATGRLSSSEPNLQNIPIRNEEGRLIRKAFVAPPKHVLLTADYSQIELRIMAHLSQDQSLLHAFSRGWDIHAATASEIFHIPLEQVSSEQRRRAKAVNFGLIYGMSAFGLAKQLRVERTDAEQYIAAYFERYPGVHQYMEKTRELAHQQGFVETLFGRRLYLPEINVQNTLRRKAAERTAINAPLQGTAADIIKKSMIAVAAWQKQHSDPIAIMMMQVHDELVFEVKENAIEEAKQIVRQIMEHTVILDVPLVVSMGTGLNWDDAHL